jgi:hypothetical protein
MTGPTHISDARWCRLVDARALGEPLSVDDEAFLAEHRSDDPAVRAERALVAALDRLGGSSDVLVLDEALLAQTLLAFDADAPARVSTATPRRRRWIAVGTLLAAGVAALWIARGPTPVPVAAVAIDDAIATAPIAVVPVVPSPTAVAPATPPRAAWSVTSGRLVGRDGDDVVAITDGDLVRAPADTCLVGADTTACVSAGSELRLADDALELVAGRAEVRVAPRVSTFVVRVAGQRVEPANATAFVIELEGDASVTMRVDEGRVRVIAADGTSKTLGAGQVHRVSLRATVKGPSAADLVTRARARRHAGDIAGAIASYERLVADFPRAPAARTAMVTLGQLHLDAGRAKLALKWFDRYLASGGALAEDAHYGRIRALRALGRTAAEERAIASFLAAYPAGSYAVRLRSR